MARVDLAALVTPALILDRRVVERNATRMADRARRAGAALWPHAKTHKSVELARLQREHGAAGLTVATLREAELFADEGFVDILVAYPPVGESRFDRLVALGRRARVRVALDDEAPVDALEARCAADGVSIGWLWERLFEEHAIATSAEPCELAVGTRVRVVPNHACAAANLHTTTHVLDGGELVDAWPVAARGWT